MSVNQAEETSIFNSFLLLLLFYYYSLQSLEDKHKTSLLIHSQSKPQVHSSKSNFFASFKMFTLHLQLYTCNWDLRRGVPN